MDEGGVTQPLYFLIKSMLQRHGIKEDDPLEKE